MFKIYNEDCMKTMNRGVRADLVLTSPPYNTGKTGNTQAQIDNHDVRYDVYIDNNKDYCQWCVDLFNSFDRILNENGVVLWNVSYGTNCTTKVGNIVGVMWLSIADIIRNTNFDVADRIVWKKKSALPNNKSSNKLTRITEDIFVFCRKSEYRTFNCNKKETSVSRVGQKSYSNIFNFIEAKNNDGANKFNKATFSTDLVTQLLNIYATKDSIVYDPFLGTGTTLVGCKQYGITEAFGSEISNAQCEYANSRINNTLF